MDPSRAKERRKTVHAPLIVRCNEIFICSFVGRKEGGINNSASYYLMSLGQDNTFEVYPVSNWFVVTMVTVIKQWFTTVGMILSHQ